MDEADKAIQEYDGASLDERVLVVEHAVAPVRIPKVKGEEVKNGKTLRVGGGRGAAADRR